MIVGTSSSILAGAVNFESEPIETQDSFENKKLTEEANNVYEKKIERLLINSCILAAVVSWLIVHRRVTSRDLNNLVKYRDRVQKTVAMVINYLDSEQIKMSKDIARELANIEKLDLNIDGIEIDLSTVGKSVAEIQEAKNYFNKQFDENKNKYNESDVLTEKELVKARDEMHNSLVEFTEKIARYNIGNLGELKSYEIALSKVPKDDYVGYGSAIANNFETLVYENYGTGLADTAMGTIKEIFNSNDKDDAEIRGCCSDFIEIVNTYTRTARECEKWLNSYKYKKVNEFYDSIISKMNKIISALQFVSIYNDEARQNSEFEYNKELDRRVRNLKKDSLFFGENFLRFHENSDLEKRSKDIYRQIIAAMEVVSRDFEGLQGITATLKN